LTKNLDNEIIGLDERLSALREELSVQGATAEEIRTALDKERTTYPVQEESPDLEAIKKEIASEPSHEDADTRMIKRCPIFCRTTTN
jgi:hypothetical protein